MDSSPLLSRIVYEEEADAAGIGNGAREAEIVNNPNAPFEQICDRVELHLIAAENPENLLQAVADSAFESGDEAIQALLFTEAYFKLTETISGYLQLRSLQAGSSYKLSEYIKDQPVEVYV